MKTESQQNPVYKWLKEWGILILAFLIITSYLIFSSISAIKSGDIQAITSSIIFTILNLLAAFYIAKKVSLWGWRSENQSNQKKIAKTAIRHNKHYTATLIKILKITKDKNDVIKDELVKQYFSEIINHLEILAYGLNNFEADFKEIVNEEISEQSVLEIEISKLLDEIHDLKSDISEYEKKISVEKKEKKSLLEDIKRKETELKNKEIELSKKFTQLPFGTTGVSGSNFYVDKDSIIKLGSSKYGVGSDLSRHVRIGARGLIDKSEESLKDEKTPSNYSKKKKTKGNSSGKENNDD